MLLVDVNSFTPSSNRNHQENFVFIENFVLTKLYNVTIINCWIGEKFDIYSE